VVAYWHSKYLQHPIYPVLIPYTEFCLDFKEHMPRSLVLRKTPSTPESDHAGDVSIVVIPLASVLASFFSLLRLFLLILVDITLRISFYRVASGITTLSGAPKNSINSRIRPRRGC
jgi:hypothetical protein